MDSSTLIQNQTSPNENTNKVFNPSALTNLPTIPMQFKWPESETLPASGTLDAPVIDLHSVLTGDKSSIKEQLDLIRTACETHGFFNVVNHGVDAGLSNETFKYCGQFFKLPVETKMRTVQQKGSLWGYSGAHSERFSEKLPWKECLSVGSDGNIGEYLANGLGKNFEPMGLVYQKYCEAMKILASSIMEVLGLSLGVERDYYKDFYMDSSYIMRCNYYPPCPEPELTQGTGRHRDPVSLTILQQGSVEGLEVFSEGTWQSVRPVPGSFVINIGDTFMALSNGIYKSCLHRAIVNRESERQSIAFFVCAKADKTIKPHDSLVGPNGKRLYPDFTWSEFLEFTQKCRRADDKTLEVFVETKKN